MMQIIVVVAETHTLCASSLKEFSGLKISSTSDGNTLHTFSDDAVLIGCSLGSSSCGFFSAFSEVASHGPSLLQLL